MRALQLGEEMNLPPHFPLPTIRADKLKEASEAYEKDQKEKQKSKDFSDDEEEE